MYPITRHQTFKYFMMNIIFFQCDKKVCGLKSTKTNSTKTTLVDLVIYKISVHVFCPMFVVISISALDIFRIIMICVHIL